MAPPPGVVSKRSGDPGALATPGMPLLTIDDTRVWRLEVPVEESRLATIVIGQETGVFVDALGGERLAGRIAEITPAADPASRTFTVKIDLPRSSGRRPAALGPVRAGGVSHRNGRRPLDSRFGARRAGTDHVRVRANSAASSSRKAAKALLAASRSRLTPKLRFGVTSPVFDLLFGAYGPTGKAACSTRQSA